MKTIILLCFVVMAMSKPIDKPVEILNQVNEPNTGDGTYYYYFQSEDGMSKEERGGPSDPKDPNSPLHVSGFYTILGEDGEIKTIHYVADQDGFRVVVPQTQNSRVRH